MLMLICGMYYRVMNHSNASISEELLAAGLANVVRHRLDEPRSSAYDALIAAENQAQVCACVCVCVLCRQRRGRSSCG
mgnify:CR=1 FL=1